MKKILFLLSMILSIPTFAKPEGDLKIHDVRLEKQNENLIVNFTVDIPRDLVKSKYKQILIPTLYNGQNQMELSTIEIIGKNKLRREKQVRLLAGNPEIVFDGVTAQNGEIITYTESIPYEPWMDRLSLRVDRKEEGCCKEELLPALALIEGQNMNPTPPAPPVTILPVEPTPEREAIEQRFVIHFRFNRANIDPTFMNNAQTLEEVADFIKKGNVKGTKIEIAGFASPEGNEAWNEKLALRRAEALQLYLVERGWTNRNSIAIVNHAINWDELRTLVTASDIPYKTRVLDILNDTTNGELTNRKLQQLQGGVPYRYLIKNVYPKLRNVSFLIINF